MQKIILGYQKPKADVIAAVPDSKGEKRFYVMQLNNVSGDTMYCWYDAVAKELDYEGIMKSNTSMNFGKGIDNTETIGENWKNKKYGEQNTNETYLDMWGVITDTEWFVPSTGEWAAFGHNLAITSENYFRTYGLDKSYWTSTIYDVERAYIAYFGWGTITGGYRMNTARHVRLSTTF